MKYVELRDIPILGAAYKLSIKPRAVKKINLINPEINQRGSVLDIGSGNCGVVKVLLENGLDVTASDIRNLSFYPEVKPIIFRENKLPFGDKSFDTVMLLTVLHHVNQDEQISLLKEARRLGNKILVMEDVYSSPLQRRLTFFMDSLVNWEFVGHPHSNRSKEEWRQLFHDLGFSIENEIPSKVIGFFDQVIFVLKP